MAHCTAEDWKYQLPWVLLGLRTAPREENPSAAENTGALVVPGELVTEDRHNPVSPEASRHSWSVAFTPPSLSSTTHIFVRDDAVRPPLTRPYKGPFRVLEGNKKAFRLALHRKDDWVSINRIKSALLEEETDVTTTPSA
ncbi:uncharacterized protein [Macrobrachium rosenbergii]|uniref:uncharacterized protein n=1 Tax=Macrobrachium rosenbergii TaxID=79674 RepID=UPI0034D57C54